LKFATPLVFDERGKISFRINGVDFSFSSDTTLQSMINTINADSRANVTMKYSRLTDGFTITADKGGAESSVTIENLSGNAFGANGAFGIGTGTVSNGKNAVLSIEGVLLEQDSNTFSIDGITYTLNGTSQEAIEFRVEQDVSKTVESIKSFVDAYNELVENIKGKLTEKDYSKEYAPLTEAQKEEMSDDQIEAWEKKAKSGILRKNGDIKRLLSSLQNAFFTAVGGSGSTMASIGITTGGFFTSDKGKIVVDTDMLTKALQENPDRVSNMFTETSEESGKTGLLHLMRDAAQTFSKNAKEDILAVTKKENDLNNRIEDMEDQLDGPGRSLLQEILRDGNGAEQAQLRSRDARKHVQHVKKMPYPYAIVTQSIAEKSMR
jgi:flagellar hook-associated protein 2